MAAMPDPLARGAAVAVLGKQILVVGGVGEDQSPVKAVEVYNTEEGRWRKRSSLREPLMGVAITVKGACVAGAVLVSVVTPILASGVSVIFFFVLPLQAVTKLSCDTDSLCHVTSDIPSL